MTDDQHGLRVDPTRWERVEQYWENGDLHVRLEHRPSFRWQAIVAEHRRQKSWRYRVAQWLRRLATRIER